MKKTAALMLLICLLVSSCAFANAETGLEVHDWVYVSSYSTTVFVSIKNGTGEPVSVDGRCIAEDTGGILLGTASTSVRVIGPGEETVAMFRFEGLTEPCVYDYDLSTGPASAAPVLSDLQAETHLNPEGVTVIVTNAGEVPAENPVLYCLFFDENDVLTSYAYSYLTDYDEELKPGAVMAEQLNAADAFDHCRVYLYAYAGEAPAAPVEPRMKQSDLSFTEYAEETPFDTTYYVIIKNSGEIPVGIRTNAIAYDADGNVLGAANDLIDVLAPGEEAPAVLGFDFVTNCDHISCRVFFDETPGSVSAAADMEKKITYADEDIQLTVTNTGAAPIRHASATVLFADAEGRVVASRMLTFTDDEGEFKPGASVTKKITPDVNFEAILVYCTSVY